MKMIEKENFELRLSRCVKRNFGLEKAEGSGWNLIKLKLVWVITDESESVRNRGAIEILREQ